MEAETKKGRSTVKWKERALKAEEAAAWHEGVCKTVAAQRDDLCREIAAVTKELAALKARKWWRIWR